MDIIITHRNPDFDALGAQIAAAKLFPGALKVVAGGIPPAVRKFLTLHLDHFELTPVKEIDFSRVTRAVVVDVRTQSRLKDYQRLFDRPQTEGPPLEVHIFDHHGSSADDLPGTEVCVEPVGSTVTLLVERLRDRDISLTPIEATALALGIYSDTGSLTFDTTTERDSRAAAFLVENGANMVVLRYFLHIPLDRPQQQALVSILSSSDVWKMNGLRLGVAHVPLEKAITGLSGVVNEAMLLSGHEGVFVFFQKGSTITVVGRSWHPSVDVGKVLHLFGGGGHQGAGAATLKKIDIAEAKDKLLAVLRADPPRSISVGDVMSTQLHTLSPDEILDDVDEVFKRKEISGAPVIKNGKIAGIISKRDIRHAKRDNRSQLAVSSCMSQTVRTINPQSPLIRVFEKMTAHGVGRLPVIENGQLIGIITRNDLIEALYRRYKTTTD